MERWDFVSEIEWPVSTEIQMSRLMGIENKK
jgi:hypothetical protein